MRLWYFLTFRWGKAFSSVQSERRYVRVVMRLDPWQGKEEKVRKLVASYFPKSEIEKVMSGIKTRSDLHFTDSSTAVSFMKKLSGILAIISHTTPAEGAPTVFLSRENWYYATDDLWWCQRDGVSTYAEWNMRDEPCCPECGGPVKCFDDLKTKEVKSVTSEENQGDRVAGLSH